MESNKMKTKLDYLPKFKKELIICLKVVILLIILSTSSAGMAQAGVGTAGGNVSDETIGYSFSVGQVFNDEISQADYYVSQGIQHSMLLIFKMTLAEYEKNAELKVYPNPASDRVHIILPSDNPQKSRVQLLNIQGRVLVDKSYNEVEFSFSLATIAPGNYILKVLTGKSEQNIFKIIKVN